MTSRMNSSHGATSPRVKAEGTQVRKEPENLGEEIKRQTDETVAQVKVESRSIVDDAKNEAQRVLDDAKRKTGTYFDNQKRRAAQEVECFADALEQVSNHYKQCEQPSTAHYVDKAIERVRRVSSDIERCEVAELADEVQAFARRRPALVLGGAVALGFFATRFFKATASEVSNETSHHTL